MNREYMISDERKAELDAALHEEGSTDKLIAQLRENLASFDAEVAFELANEGERADLWTEIDVPVESIRALLGALAAKDTALSEMRAERDEARLQQKAWADKWDHAQSELERKALEPFAHATIAVTMKQCEKDPGRYCNCCEGYLPACWVAQSSGVWK